MPGEKLEVTFYNNRVVGQNHKVFARHLGIIVRDTNICPVRVRKWNDIGDQVLDHIWSAVTDVFTNENMEFYRQHVLDHMKELWRNWRSDLLRYNLTEKNITLRAALKSKPPNGLEKSEWQWFIKEIYSNDDFKKLSERNSDNRANYDKKLMHRSGSRPIRQITWEDMGADKGIVSDLIEVFYKSRKKDNKLANYETTQKYNEMQETREKNPSLSQVEVVRQVFNPKSRDRVVGFGGGVKVKDIIGPQPSREDLQADLTATKNQNEDLINRIEIIQVENKQLVDRMGSMEARMQAFQDLLARQFNVPITSEPELHQTEVAI